MAPDAPAGGSPTPRALRWALLLLVAWLAAGTAWNGWRTWHAVAIRRELDAPPSAWLVGGKQHRALEALLTQAGEAPAGTYVLFSVAPEIDPGEAGLALLWVQHLRPQYRWRLASEVPSDAPIHLWIAFGHHPRDPRWQPQLETSAGGLYGLRR